MCVCVCLSVCPRTWRQRRHAVGDLVHRRREFEGLEVHLEDVSAALNVGLVHLLLVCVCVFK